MPDADLRQLEREAAQGDPAAGERLLRERLRRGLIDEARISLAAYLGDPAARVLHPDQHSPSEPAEYVNGLVRWGRWIVIQAGFALIQSSLARSGSESSRVQVVLDGQTPIELERGSALVLGRSRESDVRLTSSQVSRRHCRLVFDDHLWVEDLGSSNGTWLGRGPLRGIGHLEPGDRFRVGEHILEVRLAPPPGPIQGALDSLTSWLRTPTPARELLDELVLWRRPLLDPSPDTPRAQRGVQRRLWSVVEAVWRSPPHIGEALLPRGRPNPEALRCIRRSLLPIALGPDPLRWGPDPDPSSHTPVRDDPDWRAWAAAVQGELGLRVIERLGSDHRADRPLLVRDETGTLTRLAIVSSALSAEQEHWQRWERLRDLDLSAYDHPQLATVLHRHEWEDPRLGRLGCLQLEHVPGPTLEQLPQPSEHQAVSWVRACCEPAALAAKILPGWIPIDPHSVVKTERGLVLHCIEGWYVDDGRVTDEEAIQTLESLDRRLWFASIAPEEIEWQRAEELDVPRQVVHRLASLLFRLLCQAPPLSTERPLSLNVMQNYAARPLLDLRPELSPQLAAVVARALSRSPSDRYPDAVTLAEALGETPEGRA